MSAGLAVIGAIVGEFIAGGGLGSIVDIARTQQYQEKFDAFETAYRKDRPWLYSG